MHYFVSLPDGIPLKHVVVTCLSPVVASGSHKRSHSLGEKEIGRSPPSPAPEQPFRDRSNTLNEKPTLPVIRDKYKDLTGEVEESERYAYEWQRCLESALE
ncbi:hypothetical protein ATANTOWER_011909, partial [Ataeniobius toweri]|nr:hypothetical protein [Ataeniobius toweri]